jgi:hypothetical protein
MLATAACSSTTNGGTDVAAGDAQGDVQSGDDTGGGSDTGTGGDAGSGGDASMGNMHTGSVLVRQDAYMFSSSMITYYPNLDVWFSNTGAGLPGESCTHSTMSGCDIDSCSSGPGTALPNAGNMMISGLTGGPYTLMPTSMGAYIASPAPAGRIFMDGETVNFSAAGMTGEVPAFTGMLTVPPSITVTMPMLMTGMTTIPRSSDLVINWTGGSTGDVTARLLSSSAGVTTLVSCTYQASAGTGTIPMSVMMQLAAGSGAITIGSSVTQNVMAGDYAVTLSILNGAASAAAMFN